MKAFYGFKVKGNVTRLLEQFKDFQWVPNVYDTGFLGVEMDSTEYVLKTISFPSTEYILKTISFPKMLENYLMIAYLAQNKGLSKKIMSYQKEEKSPVIYVKLKDGNKFFDNLDDYNTFMQSQSKKNKP